MGGLLLPLWLLPLLPPTWPPFRGRKNEVVGPKSPWPLLEL